MMHSPTFLSDALIQALGWTLVHSLWQGAAIALILWLVLPRLSRSNHRYWASYAALLTVLVAACISFVWVYTTRETLVELAPGASDATFFSDGGIAAAPLQISFWQNLAQHLEPYHPLIVSIWLLGFVFFLFQLGGGLRYIYRLRRSHNQPLEPLWQEKLQALASRIGLSHPVGLLESALVKAPMALGFFKPLILLPIGMANQLSPVEVEAILAHELAHIARRDWLFNLMQAIIEALFYFHPAVWWIAATIRAERENCCDDTAVALTGNRLVYAKTLVRLQDITRPAPVPSLTLGIDGAPNLLRRRPLLLERIKRILHQPQQSASLMEKTIAMAILVALITLLTVRANTPPALVESIREIAEKPMTWLAQVPTPHIATSLQAPARDSVPDPVKRQRIVREDDDQKVEMQLENGKITQLKIDGQEIAPENYNQYESLTESLRQDMTPPSPPSPPSPPNEPFGVWAEPRAPRAPFPPHRSSSRISTETDDKGNTVIKVERNGQPLEIKVKDGEVWVEDEKIEVGETMDIDVEQEWPGRAFWFDGDKNMKIDLDGNRLHFRSPEGLILEAPDGPQLFEFKQNGDHFIFKGHDGLENFSFEMPELSKADLARIQTETAVGLEKERKALEKQMRELEKQMQQSDKDQKKEQKEQYRAMQEAQRALEDAQVAQKRAMERAFRDKQRVREDVRRVEQRDRVRALQFQTQTESYGSVIPKALLKDKLIDDPDNYTFEISKKDMRVNGKKQSDTLHTKYLELYRKYNRKEIGNDKVKIRVRN
ncbi:MAG: M48 family metalloprotease [Lewinellaceae bacterium]|nr:M48 family metalloprotease [Saprospiraceae bacterium]MCB9331061.1 M48 family metalloprotease [Lewinellaceae bacterium]